MFDVEGQKGDNQGEEERAKEKQRKPFTELRVGGEQWGTSLEAGTKEMKEEYQTFQGRGGRKGEIEGGKENKIGGSRKQEAKEAGRQGEKKTKKGGRVLGNHREEWSIGGKVAYEESGGKRDKNKKEENTQALGGRRWIRVGRGVSDKQRDEGGGRERQEEGKRKWQSMATQNAEEEGGMEKRRRGSTNKREVQDEKVEAEILSQPHKK